MLQHLSTELLWSIGGIFGLLVLATIVVAILRRANPTHDFTELAQRVKTWWMMAGVFTLAMLLSPTVSIVFLGFVSFLALKEFLSLIPTRRADRRVLFWAYLAIPMQFYWVASGWYGMFVIFIPVYMFLLLPTRMILIGETEGFLRAAGTLNWGLMMTVFSISHAAYLLVLGQGEQGAVSPGPGLLLCLVFLTQFNDVSQYVWGKLFGNHKRQIQFRSATPGMKVRHRGRIGRLGLVTFNSEGQQRVWWGSFTITNLRSLLRTQVNNGIILLYHRYVTRRHAAELEFGGSCRSPSPARHVEGLFRLGGRIHLLRWLWLVLFVGMGLVAVPHGRRARP